MNEPWFSSSLIFIELIFSLMILKSLKKAGGSNRLVIALGIIFIVWLMSVYTMLSIEFFSTTGFPQVAFTFGVVVPVVFGLIAFIVSKPLASAINNIPLSGFLALQQMRAVFGVMFFFSTSLPLWFQYLGGLGDIAAGIGALLASRYLQKHPNNENQANIMGNLVGILDFIIVLDLGVFVVLKGQSPDIMFNLIPLYVVPIFILLHVFSLLRLRTSNEMETHTAT